jgi:hypothetical protein
MTPRFAIAFATQKFKEEIMKRLRYSPSVLACISLLCSLLSAQEAVVSTASPTAAVSGTGTTDFLPLWTNSTGALGNSVLFQSGTGSTAKVGINTTAPAATLDVNGSENVHGTLSLPALGTATATAGENSRPVDFTASAFNSGTATAVPEKFQWQAEPTSNDTASPSGAMSLLFASGTATPAETGLKISSKGVITFASGQTFPGGGSFCIAVSGGFGGGGTTYVNPGFTVPAENKCTQWSGYTKTASTVILNTSGAACLSSTGKTLTVSVSNADPEFFGTTPEADYIQLTRAGSSGTFTGGSDQGTDLGGSANQITCTSSLLTLPDSHD